eukprot:TRINITY_DN1021_c0_g1_i2.p1 TRINITY_DN1021_c0_g1~~TRINITY_DN1021_c0_g1_i2.p1  ORF type:complete len:200 (-),score=53.16 TRINITY_DN1021_c0_g1_i2:1134-1733(-)
MDETDQQNEPSTNQGDPSKVAPILLDENSIKKQNADEKKEAKKRSREERKAFNREQKKQRKMKKQEEAETFDVIQESDLSLGYQFHQGLRFVQPYYFQFEAWAKRRWLGKTFIEVLTQEFKAHPPEYYKLAVEDGRILVNGNKVSPDWIVKDSSHITHRIHRHEPPVSAKEIEILHHDDSVIVIDKPSSIPVLNFLIEI